IASDFEKRLFTPGVPEQLVETVWGENRHPHFEGRWASWKQNYVGATRVWQPQLQPRTEVHEGFYVERSGGVVAFRGYGEARAGREDDPEDVTRLKAWLAERFKGATSVLAVCGAHGDLQVKYVFIPPSDRLHFDNLPPEIGFKRLASDRFEVRLLTGF